jgi:hypothetical protein
LTIGLAFVFGEDQSGLWVKNTTSTQHLGFKRFATSEDFKDVVASDEPLGGFQQVESFWIKFRLKPCPANQPPEH